VSKSIIGVPADRVTAIIGKLLGHTQVQTTARYAHLAADPVKSAADSVAASLREALG
jgi:integrase